MISYQYKETCEVLLNDPKIGEGGIKYFVKKAIRNLLHANTNFHSKRLISELPGDGLKCISKLQLHCANMTFSEKGRYDRLLQQVIHKGGDSEMSYIKRYKVHRL